MKWASAVPDIPPMFENQVEAMEFGLKVPKHFNTSDPGTGKTRTCLELYKRRLEGRMLVIAPLSILEASWGADIRQFLPGFSYEIAHGRRKVDAFNSGCDIVVLNTDGVKWVAKDLSLLKGFSTLVIDEFTAFKNGGEKVSERARVMRTLVKQFEYIIALSGTPNSNTVRDMWYPALLLDGGARLGNKYWKFRSDYCESIQVGSDAHMVKWDDKVHAADDVGMLLHDITIRHTLEECHDIPPMHKTLYTLQAPAWLMKHYRQLENSATLDTEDGKISAIHAGAKVRKMLQLLSGAVYDENGVALRVHDNRYKLVTELIAERQQCTVAYNWHHELASLSRFADAAGFSYAVINGSVKASDRPQIVSDFQQGKTKVLFMHPQSASHGLTLTAGTTTIWCSPTYSAEHYEQFNHRIYRAGQTRKTETIRIGYADTAEMEVYEKLDTKLGRMEDLLSLFTLTSKSRNVA